MFRTYQKVYQTQYKNRQYKPRLYSTRHAPDYSLKPPDLKRY